MKLFSSMFGSRPAAVPSAVKPVDPAVLEWRALNELPPPALKPLPLDPAAPAVQSPLHPPLKPARIVDEMPADYAGELYYRIVKSQRGRPAGPKHYVTLPPRKGEKLEDQLGQRLMLVWPNHAAAGRDTGLFAAPGELHADFRAPLPAGLLAGAEGRVCEFAGDGLPVISSRVRQVLEALEPGAHLFLPLDLGNGAEPRPYVFFAGVAFRPTAVAVEANGIADLLLPGGGLSFRDPKLSLRHFYRLNRRLIGHTHVFHDTLLGSVFSQRAVALLGDVLEREYAFMPVGLCDEPLPGMAHKVTRHGDELPIG